MSITIPSQSTSSNGSIVVTESHKMASGAPSDGRDISIEEPVSGNSRQVLLFNVGDSGGDFRSGDNSVEVQELVSDGLSDIVTSFVLQQFVVKSVLSSEDFNLTHGVGVVRSDDLTSIEHLVRVDFITMEITSEKTSIRVRSIDALVEGNIRKRTQQSM